MTPDLDELLHLARRLATDTAAVLVEGLGAVKAVGTKSSPTDMVTEMDHLSERLIVEGLRQARPHDTIVSEEGTNFDGSTGVRWIIDPIDGTTNYLYGHPGFAVSIAAAYESDVVVGAVADPLHGDYFTAVRGRGAWRNDEPLVAPQRSDLSDALVATGFSYQPERRRQQADVLRVVLPAIRDIRRMGAASVDLCSVACGRVDAYYERGLAPWDFAAGALVATEAGIRTGDLTGGQPSTDFVIAAPPGLFDALTDLLTRANA